MIDGRAGTTANCTTCSSKTNGQMSSALVRHLYGGMIRINSCSFHPDKMRCREGRTVRKYGWRLALLACFAPLQEARVLEQKSGPIVQMTEVKTTTRVPEGEQDTRSCFCRVASDKTTRLRMRTIFSARFPMQLSIYPSSRSFLLESKL